MVCHHLNWNSEVFFVLILYPLPPPLPLALPPPPPSPRCCSLPPPRCCPPPPPRCCPPPPPPPPRPPPPRRPGPPPLPRGQDGVEHFGENSRSFGGVNKGDAARRNVEVVLHFLQDSTRNSQSSRTESKFLIRPELLNAT